MTSPFVLPRSLEPLADESLFGFVLRLGHRLEQPPHFLVKAAGLTARSGAPSRIPTGLVLRLHPEQATCFARACRLSEGEVSSLTMEGLGNRYPPADYIAGLGRHGPELRQAQGFPSLRRWMSTHPARYCPQCLAGDSAIESEHGGPWRKSWHLPMVFACPLHKQLLVAICPVCGRRPSGASATSGLIANSTEIMHPAQCRSPLPTTEPHPRRAPRSCGQRLDLPQITQQQTAITPLLLALQDRLLGLLDNRGPTTTTCIGKQVTIPHYMMDLRLVSVLISASWPSASPSVASAEIRECLEHYADARQTDLEDRQQQGNPLRFAAIHDTPPADPAACGAMLAAAETILTSTDSAHAGEMLRPMLAKAVLSPQWRTFLENAKKPCSPEVRTLFETITEQVRPPRRPRRSPGPGAWNGWLEYHRSMGHTVTEPTGDCQFDHRHIPQNMTDGWFADHFGKSPGINPRHLRRIAAIRLVQMSTGGSLARAAVLLGLPASCTESLSHTIAHWSRDPDNANKLNTAIRAFAHVLNQDPGSRIDYGKRRSFLADWTVPLSDWERLVAEIKEIRGLPPSHRMTPNWSERRRYVASVLIWEALTQGDRVFAPILRPGGQAYGHSTWIRQDIWHALNAEARRESNAGRAALVALIPNYARQLASVVDSAPS